MFTYQRRIYTKSVFVRFVFCFCFFVKKYALFRAQFYKSLSALSRVLLLYILTKILFKNFVHKQHKRSQGGQEARPLPNRNASNETFVTKTAILSSISFSWFVYTLT